MNKLSEEAGIRWIPVPQMGVEVAETPVTRAQWRAVMGPDTEPEKLWTEGAEDLPATHVNWFEAMEFAEKVGGRLPGSEEFRLLALAGREEMPEPLEDYAVFGQQQICPVRTKRPNAWGLYDMAGLVWEWCLLDEDLVTPLRGGSWHDDQDVARAVYRSFVNPYGRYNLVGLRPLRGGSWGADRGLARTVYRVLDGPASRDGFVGLRPLRGGAWSSPQVYARAASRNGYYGRPALRLNNYGFRVVRESSDDAFESLEQILKRLENTRSLLARVEGRKDGR